MTTQMDCSIGLVPETTFGTAVTVSQFPEFVSETLDSSTTYYQGQGLRVGSVVDRAGRRSTAQINAGGNITLEAPIKGLGIFLQAALGAATSTAIPSQTGAFQQVHTLLTSGDYPKSYTVQKGIPRLGGGVVDPLTFLGMVCSGIEFQGKIGDALTVSTDWVGREVQTAVSYAAPSYPTGQDIYTFNHGAITIGGTVTMPTATALATGGTAVADIQDFDVKIDNGLDSDGWNLGGAGKRTRPPVLGKRAITGTVTVEYDATTMRDAYLNQTDLALVLTFTHTSTVGTSAHPVIQIIIPDIRLEGSLPQSNGGSVIAPSVAFTGLDNLTASPITVVYVTADTAI